MKASVSTIIPCYRCSDTIGRAVDSVAKQTLLPAEVILVDDGSGDETLKTLQQLQQDYGKDWIKVIALEKNHGPAVPRNTAWDTASHEYIAFLDADDSWHPEKIAVQYSWMLEHPEIALSGHGVIVKKTRNLQLNHNEIPETITASLINRNKILLSNAFCTSSVMVKRSIKQRFNPSLRYSQDYFLWLEIVLSGIQAAVLNFTGAYYFKEPFGVGGQTKNLLNGKKAESQIYQKLWKSGYITFFEWRLLSLWSLIKYYRRSLICLLR
ncbi:MAG: glycosyltransferase family 2 protein [Calothrix sp. MO_167.B12]|nr:glycosyltransferase family 2 protein [Calothrix sp. MO_167.B12]